MDYDALHSTAIHYTTMDKLIRHTNTEPAICAVKLTTPMSVHCDASTDPLSTRGRSKRTLELLRSSMAWALIHLSTDVVHEHAR